MVASRLLQELTLFALRQVAGLQPASVRRRLALLAELKDRVGSQLPTERG